MSCSGEHDGAGRRFVNAHHQAREGRLAAARLADHADGLALGNVEVDAVDGAHDLALAEEILARQGEMLDEPAYRQHRRVRAGGRSLWLLPAASGRGGFGRAGGDGCGQGFSRLRDPAARFAPRRDLLQRRVLAALGDAERASLLEPAADGHGHRVGRRALDRDQPLALGHVTVDTGDGVDESPGVGVARVGQHLLCGPLLHDLTRIHDEHALTHAGDDAQRVADEDDGGAEVAVELADEVEDLRLDRHVERGGGLVRDQQGRLVAEAQREHDALTHAAGELMRIAVDGALGRGDTHAPEQ